MEVGFGRGVGRKGNGMMRERMKTEEKMRWNTMTLEFESRPCNESFARVSAAAFLAQLNPTVEEVADVKTAISEAVTNAMIHGYRQEKGKIQMKCVLDLEEKVFQVSGSPADAASWRTVRRGMVPSTWPSNTSRSWAA